MFRGVFIALEYQYLNLRVEPPTHPPPISMNVHGKLSSLLRNKHRHLVLFAADARGWAFRSCGRGWKARWKETPADCSLYTDAVIRSTSSQALPSLSLSGPQPTSRCTRALQKSSSRHQHLGSIAFWDCSQKHLYPPHSLCSLSVSLYSCEQRSSRLSCVFLLDNRMSENTFNQPYVVSQIPLNHAHRLLFLAENTSTFITSVDFSIVILCIQLKSLHRDAW